MDVLLQRTLEMSIEAYEPQASLELESKVISGPGGFPVYIFIENETIYVVFRGTNDKPFSGNIQYEELRNSFGNIITDLYTKGGVKLSSYQVFSERLQSESLKLQAHGGFIDELSVTYKDIRDEIDSLSGKATDIVFTGHSAGGALTTLIYYIYQNDFSNKEFKLPVRSAVTYGSPRVIINDTTTVELYNRSCPNLLRVFNSLDIITYLPFNKPLVIPTRIANGYTHVGQPLPLDSNIQNNSLDALVLLIVNGNREAYKLMMDNYTLDQLRENDIMRFITSNEYMAVMAGASFQCVDKVGIRDVPDETFILYTQELYGQAKLLQSYRDKCSLGKPFFIEDLLLRYQIGETPEQQNLAIATLIASVVRYNLKGIQAHLTSTYSKNLTILVDREVNKRVDIMTPLESVEIKEAPGFQNEEGETIKPRKIPEEATNYVTPIPIPVTAQSVSLDLMTEIQKDIARGKIIGITEDIEHGSMVEIS